LAVLNDTFDQAAALELHDGNPVQLSRNIVQIMDMLQLYQAEMARSGFAVW